MSKYFAHPLAVLNKKMLRDLILYITLTIFGSLIFSGNDNYVTRGLLLGFIAYGIYLRIKSGIQLYSGKTVNNSTAILSVVSHMGVFALVYLIISHKYTNINPTLPTIDALSYAVDTLITNGDSGIRAVDSVSKSIHIINLLDTYLLLATFGYYIFRTSKLDT